jgi:hypothetical protein
VDGLLAIVVVVLMLVAFDLAALRWGIDSTDEPDSPEWQARRGWRGWR